MSWVCRASAALVAVAALAGCSSAADTDADRPVPSGAATSTTQPTVSTAPGSTATAPAPTSTTVWPPARVTGEPDAATVAEALGAIETALIDPTTSPDQRARLGVEQQLWYRYLGGRPELDEAVLAALPSEVRPQVERVVRARQFAQQRAAANPQPLDATLPAWTIADPLPAATLRGYYDEAQALTGIDWWWLAAINLQETRFGRIVGVSSAGAVGPMQFLPSTWAECCTGDPTVARDAIIGAATYLAQSGGPADMLAALDQYNPNASYVAIVTAYAENLRDHPELLDAYHAWQVFVGTTAGTVRLPIGFRAAQPVDAAAYLARHPDDLATVTP